MEVRPEQLLEQQLLSASFQSLLNYGQQHVAAGRLEKAKQYYEHAASVDPDSAEPYVGIAAIALQEQQLDDAEISFRVALRLNNKCSRAAAGMAMVAQQKGDYEQALQRFLDCLEIDPDNMTAILGLFQTSSQMGSFEKVTHYLELYLASHPADTAVMSALASLYIKDDNLSLARKQLCKVMILDPENTDAANLLEEVEHNLACRRAQACA